MSSLIGIDNLIKYVVPVIITPTIMIFITVGFNTFIAAKSEKIATHIHPKDERILNIKQIQIETYTKIIRFYPPLVINTQVPKINEPNLLKRLTKRLLTYYKRKKEKKEKDKETRIEVTQKFLDELKDIVETNYIHISPDIIKLIERLKNDIKSEDAVEITKTTEKLKKEIEYERKNLLYQLSYISKKPQKGFLGYTFFGKLYMGTLAVYLVAALLMCISAILSTLPFEASLQEIIAQIFSYSFLIFVLTFSTEIILTIIAVNNKHITLD